MRRVESVGSVESGTGRGRGSGAGRALAGLVLSAALVAFAATAARAQAEGAGGPPAGDAPGPFSVRSGMGFSADPGSFLLAFEGDYAFTPHVSAGVLVELGLDDHLTIVSPVGYGRYRFDLSDFSDEKSLHPLHPYVQGGLGFTFFDRDVSGARRLLGVDDEDTELLLNLGFGLEYEVDPHVSVVSQMLFNIIPGEIFGNERFYYSWEVLSVRYRF